MEPRLTEIEARVLGCLIEKQMSTPDYYPMTMNALVNACNQKSNRDPVMEVDDAAVEQTLEALRRRRLVWQVKVQGSRVLKYEHNFKDVAPFTSGEMAVICELLLRGPQTPGELRSRTARLNEFPGVAAVEHALQKLAEYEEGPFVTQLPRRPGQKENRWAELFREVDLSQEAAEPVRVSVEAVDEGRLEILERRVAELEAELAELKARFLEFKGTFE